MRPVAHPRALPASADVAERVQISLVYVNTYPRVVSEKHAARKSRRRSGTGRSSMNVALYVVTVAQCVYAASVGVGRVAVEGRRTCRLYCRVGIGFHLQIHEDGRVNGSHEPNHLSVLELFAVSQGVIGIRGVHSNLFLSMNHRGRLLATEHFSEDCMFRERFQENSYNTYASVAHMNRRSGRQWYVALNKRGKAKMGSSPRVKSQHVSTHFLPRGGLSARPGLGFTITEKESEQSRGARTKEQPNTRAKEAEASVNAPAKRTRKYWPKYRFG
ncbi:hypothetical protein WMY93_020401 [Mugilogobius chulae]|uniref:Fibroblast growth factor n=1 Tax=Mugilogobius chulae TaxID=88201 RepID=A0AAW0NI41_9GOBI